MVWAQATVNALAGTNEELEARLHEIFRGTISFNGVLYPAIPPSPSAEEQLQNYYALLE